VSPDVSDLSEIKQSITRMEGKIETLVSDYKAGDRGNEASVRLLTQAQEYQAQAQQEDRQDLKRTIEKFDERTAAIESGTDRKVSAVRLDLQSQLGDHKTDEAPHNGSLGKRLSVLEDFRSKIIGGFLLIGAVGVTDFALIFIRTSN
jgi:hypothetical protein